jgi:imidazolonepropionase-like amidohydrolase
MSADLGTIESGKLADLTALDRDPLEDINAVHQVCFVMQGGQVVRALS